MEEGIQSGDEFFTDNMWMHLDTTLAGEGVPPALRSNELHPIGHWFLKPFTDFRSAGALETPMSEFGCHGLELDYACLCWGAI
jgi:hypothetical protein